MRTPLSHVRHYGAAHDGTGHFWMERVTGAASLLLTIVMIVLAIRVAGRPYEEAVAVIGSPLVATLVVLFLAATAMHMRIGMEAILVDYVPREGQKIFWLIANTFFSILLAVAGMVAVVLIAVGG